MSKKHDLVTVGILCYNAEASILKAIKSALSQTYKNIEIIVVDDCSIDNSVEIIKKSTFYKDIKLFLNKKNQGPGFSRNVVLKNAKGSFICFMDDDDISDKKRIEVQINSIFNEGYDKNNCVLSICNIYREYPSGYIQNMKVFGTYFRKPSSNEMIDFLLFNNKKKGIDYGFGCPTCAMLISKKALSMIGGFDDSLRRVEDMDLTLRLCQIKCYLVSSKETFVNQFSTSGDDKSPLKNLKAEIKIIKKNKDYLRKKHIYFYSRLWPYLRFYHFNKNYFYLLLILIVLIIINPVRTIKHFSISSIRRIKHERKISSLIK